MEEGTTWQPRVGGGLRRPRGGDSEAAPGRQRPNCGGIRQAARACAARHRNRGGGVADEWAPDHSVGGGN
jgi:hypothetical protein